MNGPVVADLREGDFTDTVIAHAHARARELSVPLVFCRIVPRAAKTLSQGDDDAVLAARVNAVTGRSRDQFTLIHPYGDALSCLVSVLEALSPSLLVTAPGLTAMLAMRYVDTPILIARPNRGGAVLAATDFSDPSFPALTAGVREAARNGKRLRFFHAVNAETRSRQRNLPADGLIEDIKQQLRSYAREHNISVEALAVAGEPATELARLTTTTDTDLLVVARRRTRPGRYFQPTTGDLAITAVNCSVLVVPKKA